MKRTREVLDAFEIPDSPEPRPAKTNGSNGATLHSSTVQSDDEDDLFIAPASPPAIAPPSPPAESNSDRQPNFFASSSANEIGGLSSAALANALDNPASKRSASRTQPAALAALSANTFLGRGPRGKQVVRHLGTIRFYNGRRLLGKIIPDSGGDDLFIPAQGAPNGNQVSPQPGGLFHGTRVSFLPLSLSTGEAVSLPQTGKPGDIICMDVQPVPGQFGLSCGVDTDTGGKKTNEDRIVAVDIVELGFMTAIFDGHRGHECANFVAQNLPAAIHAEWRKQVKRERGGTITSLSTQREVSLISNALVDAFETTDKAWLQVAHKKGMPDGTTAVVAIVCHGFESQSSSSSATPGEGNDSAVIDDEKVPERVPGTIPTAPGGVAKLFVAWCGDSRCLLLRGRTGFRCSEDHRPTRTDEQERVKRAGGRVMKDSLGIWRVGPREENRYAQELEKGKKKEGAMKWWLSCTRAFGDPELKLPDPIVVSTADVRVVDIVPEDWAVLLGCDGIFDYLSDQQIADVVWKSMAMQGQDCIETAKSVVQAALRSGSKDNLTVVIDRLGWAPVPPAGSGSVAAAAGDMFGDTVAADETDMFG